MRRLLVLALVATALLATPSPARAACAASSSTRTFGEMIGAGSTFDPYFHRMIVGRVVAIRDPAPAGGKAKAVIAVAAHPTGFVPVVARVRFYRPPPGTWIEDNLEFKLGQRWVVIARHLHADGSYATDGGCGRSRSVSRDKFRSLIALDRRLS